MLGQLIDGKYQVTRLLGEGGMGAVYEATHTGTSRRVAVKVILGAEVSKNEEMVGRFQREARAAGSIDTQHIVQVLDTGLDRSCGLPFMVMEFLAGEDLEQLVTRIGPLAPEIALRITAQACVGLQKAHEAGVVHRDIKPANLYLAQRDGGEVIVKVLDFGIAKIKQDRLSSSEDQGLTRTGSMLGSPLYMSPEQAKGLRSVDHRTDIWSLGAVMYEALTGRSPHHDKDTLGQLILAICSQPPSLVQDHAPWVPPEIAAIAHGALTLEVEKRFQSAQAMLDAMAPLLPDGFLLTQSMLGPLPEEQRANVAPRLALSIPGVSLDVSQITSFGQATTTGGLSRSAAISPKSKKAPLALAAFLVASAAGIGAYTLTNEEPPRAPQQATTPPDPVPPAKEVLENVPPHAPVAFERTVKLAVLPANVTVEIDGEPADVVEGEVEIKGALGSLHPVKLRLGTNETSADVVVTEAGAIPASLKLEAPISKPSSAPAKPTKPSSAAAKPTKPSKADPAVQQPAKKPAGVTIDRTFE